MKVNYSKSAVRIAIPPPAPAPVKNLVATSKYLDGSRPPVLQAPTQSHMLPTESRTRRANRVSN